MASKTPKSNLTSSTSPSKTSKTTATSKAATKKPVAKKAAAARGPAVAAEPPAPAKKAAKKTATRKAAAGTAAPTKSPAKPAARAATAKAATSKAATAKAAPRPAARPAAKKTAAVADKNAAQPAAPVKTAPRKTSRRAVTKDTADTAAQSAVVAEVAETGATAVPGSTAPASVTAAAPATVEPAAPTISVSPAAPSPETARASAPVITATSEREAAETSPATSADASAGARVEASAGNSPGAGVETSPPAQPAHAGESPAPVGAAADRAPDAAGDTARDGSAADAAEDRRPRVLRRAGAGKPARPAVKPSWETYPEPLQALVDAGRRMLGIDNLRPGQAEALGHVMNRRDLLAVMPTGSGKSLLYQLPSLVLDGLTVVVSPLIALIKDQLDKMEERGVAVCRFDSTLTVKQRREAEALVQAPGGKLVFVTPERISDSEFREFLRTGAGGRGVALFVVDEAHCVSQWGHDFRPSYLTLRKAIDDLGRPPLLATTATAPPHVREDILHQLGMPEAAIVTTTFERPNLHFEVMALPSEEDKLKTLVTLLKKLPRPGVVYCATVKKVEELYESLHRHAIPVARYHGRMGKKDRDTEQERLMDAKDMVMIATNAFGLGVDKANIRYVLHYHVPGSLEAYAQEAGRGGRDGKPSRCVLMFSPDDVAIQEYFLTGTYPSRRQVRAVYKALSIWSPSEEAPPTIANLALASHVGTQRTRTVLSLLKDEGFVVEREEGTFWLADDRPSDEVLNEKAKQYEARRIADRQRLDALLAYVKTPRCRNQVILEYLGELEAPPCGRCDNCQRSREAALAAADQASRLEAKATAELNQEWSADSSDRDAEEESKPRRVIRHRVIRIDEPAAVEEQAAGQAAPAPVAGKPGKPAGDEPRPRAVAENGTAADERSHQRPSNGQMRLPLGDAARANGSSVTATSVAPIAAAAAAATVAGPATAVAPLAAGSMASELAPASPEASPPWAAPAGAGAAPVPPAADDEGIDEDEDEDDEYIDDEEGDEYIDDEEGEEDEDEDEYEDEDEDDEEDEDEYEDDEEGEEDEEYEDEEYDEDEDEDEDGEEDDEYDDEDFELIEKTAAALAEEGFESDTEITILARKRVEKPRPQKAHDSAAQNEADASKRRRKRRRRRKKRSMLPPKSAFITPVLSKESEIPVGPSRGRRRKAGPVIEYVRGPMRINMTPVASATPNDVAPSRKKKKRRRRGDEPVYPGMAAGNGASAPSAPPSDENGGRKRRRRRRRRKRAGGNMRPMQHEGPVAFFSTQWPPSDPGARDEGGRRRRRRKRRGRNGRAGSQGGRTEPQPPRPLPPPSGE